MSTVSTQTTGLSFAPTELQLQIQDMVRKYGEEKIRPHVLEWDEAQYFPVAVFKELGQLGLMGMLVPEAYGGSGLGYHEYVTAIAELGRICGGIGLSMAAHNSLCTGHILQFGSEAQKQKYLPRLATAEYIGAWGLTEANTGSDASNMNTYAERDGDHWVINGSKNFITHGKSGDVAVILARTGERRMPSNATAFIIEKGTPGFSAGKKENKLGMRASETTELILEQVRIPDSQRMGQVGDGFHQAMKVLDGGRISIAALSLGIAKGAMNHALKYAQEREQFEKPIFDHQAIAFKLAWMATEIEVAELLTHQAADLKNKVQQMTKESAMAKYVASEVCVRVANEGVQIHGGYGYIKDYPAEKYYRDAKLCTIGEGTSEIQQLVISRQLVK
ncbi:MAG: acyl-CoA dehydrogenase family protein [Sphingobacteriia bacterium]